MCNSEESIGLSHDLSDGQAEEDIKDMTQSTQGTHMPSKKVAFLHWHFKP